MCNVVYWILYFVLYIRVPLKILPVGDWDISCLYLWCRGRGGCWKREVTEVNGRESWRIFLISVFLSAVFCLILYLLYILNHFIKYTQVLDEVSCHSNFSRILRDFAGNKPVICSTTVWLLFFLNHVKPSGLEKIWEFDAVNIKESALKVSHCCRYTLSWLLRTGSRCRRF